MTLMEVMIAIALLAFVMLGVVGITDNAQNSKDRTVVIDRDNLQVETAMARLDWDFSHIWSPLYFTQKFQGNLNPQENPGVEEVAYLYENHPRLRMPSKEGLPIPYFRSKEKDEIVFLSAGNRRKLANQRQSPFMWVRYYLGDTPEDPDAKGEPDPKSKKSLMRQVFPEDPWSKEELDFEGTKGAVLLEQVEKLEFSFWNPNSKKWETNLTTIPDGDLLSRGLQLVMTWYDSQGAERTTTRWFRPFWPPVLPQDPGQNGAATGGTPGNANAGTTGGGTNAQGGNTNPDNDPEDVQ